MQNIDETYYDCLKFLEGRFDNLENTFKSLRMDEEKGIIKYSCKV